MEEKDRFCLIPESGINVLPNGDITPCCVSDYKLGHITTDSLTDTFYGEKYTEFREAHRRGELPKTCIVNCVNKKNNFSHIESRKVMMRHAEKRGLKYLGKEKLVNIDIGIGNVCNLKCTFCNEDWSSAWAKFKDKKNSIFFYDEELTLKIAGELDGINDISFKGGEPLNIPYLDKFLTEIKKKNLFCQIGMVTNGTETNNKINSALFDFYFQPAIAISTEATGKLYQYLRGGNHTWNHVIDNIKSFQSHGLSNIHISSLILLYNYTTWADDMLLIQDQLDELDIKTTVSAQLCVYPPTQSIFLLNKEQRLRLVNSINNAVEKGLIINGLEDMINSLLEDRLIKTTKEEVLKAIEYNNNMRGMDLLSIVEDFTPHIVTARDQD